MIRINQIKLPVKYKDSDLKKIISKKLHLNNEDYSYSIVKKSIDARKKDDIKYIIAVDVNINKNVKVPKLHDNNIIMLTSKSDYLMPAPTGQPLNNRPVVIGMGPAGLFCALHLARAGYKPIVFERGQDVDKRVKTINKFWDDNELDEKSNVQFGEGGAGTFSDGKLNSVVKDKFGRHTYILKTFVEFGAPEEITYVNKPHIGTDKLVQIVKNIRNEIISLGGTIHFNKTLTNIQIKNNKISSITVNNSEVYECEKLVLAVGHSARDTFSMLKGVGINMEKKAFAIGLRIEHPSKDINIAQYGDSKDAMLLPTADYKLTHQATNGRSIFSFCMCPGGYVVNSSSEKERIVVNGMSNYKRDALNSNSALVVSVMPSDFSGDDCLAGVEFQRKWEHRAYVCGGGNGNVPIQLFKDYSLNKESSKIQGVIPSIKGNYTLSNLNECLPAFVNDAIIEGVLKFGSRIDGYSRDDSILSGVETRTSSPVRILRNDLYNSNYEGIYPCGEGAGYAGGITSAAIDGLKVAEAIICSCKPE